MRPFPAIALYSVLCVIINNALMCKLDRALIWKHLEPIGSLLFNDKFDAELKNHLGLTSNKADEFLTGITSKYKTLRDIHAQDTDDAISCFQIIFINLMEDFEVYFQKIDENLGKLNYDFLEVFFKTPSLVERYHLPQECCYGNFLNIYLPIRTNYEKLKTEWEKLKKPKKSGLFSKKKIV